MPSTIHIDWCQQKWKFLRPENLESLWDSITTNEFSADERLPYWVEIWPASLALASFLQKQQQRITHKMCLDLGCGLGFTALVGAKYGAKVLGVDYEQAAVDYAVQNAQHNNITNVTWAVMDWRMPAVQKESCDVIWAGDIMYEQRFVEPVLNFLQHALKKTGSVWIAEPNRNIFASFKECLVQQQWQATCVQSMQVPALHQQKNLVSVDIWQLEKGKTV